uniref:Uncharacterized protein n=1 Tax=Globodera rostochiensis TaxID=31243 RepID=A0A914HWC3_GLORO
MVTLQYRKLKGLVRFLLSKGARTDRTTNGGEVFGTFFAPSEGHLDVCRELVAKGTNGEADDIFFLPWLAARDKGHLDIVELFVENGLDIEFTASDGASELIFASLKGNALCAFCCRRACALIAPLSPFKNSILGLSPLLLAATAGHLEVCRELVAKGADGNLETNDGMSPWIKACEKGHLDIVKLFVDNGQDIETTNKFGVTGLIAASREGKTNVARFLLSKGAHEETFLQRFIQAQEEATGRAAPKELQWSEKCEGKEHEFCGRLLCAQLDAALICAFVLRSGAAVSTTVAKDLVKLILGADQGQEPVLYEGIRRDNVRAGAFPEESDVERIWALWSEKCTVAKAILQEPGFGAIKIATPEVVQKLPETEKTGWAAIFEQTGWILEKVRATVVHHCPVFIELPRIILGDSSAFQLFGDMRDQTTFVGTERGSLSAVIRALNECVMSSKVQAVLVVLGRDSLMNDETVDQIVEQSARIQHLCRRFPSVRIIWLPPPYVREKEGAYNELIGRLAALLGDWFLCVTPTGRSLVELWRYGDSYDRSRVETNGWMTPGGVRAFAAWVKSQIPAWPGNRELGVRSGRSPVDLVRGARLGPGDRPSPSAFQRPGPRFDDRIGSRPHPYRSLPNSARAWHHRDEPVHRWSGRAQR